MTTAPSSPPDPSRPPLARIVELALVVPAEVGSRLLEVVPAVADKVPMAADRVRREIVLARFLGKLVVDQGVRELRSRLSPEEAPHVEPAATLPAEPVEDAPTSPHTVAVDSLALAHYDHLSSAQIIAKLSGLDAGERTAIETYERAGRHRRTVLGKIEQLRAGEAES